MTIKGMLLFVTGDLTSGIALVEEARRIQERMNDREGGGMALSFLAQMSFAKGDHARALALYGEALESLAAIGDQPEVARVHCEMGWTALVAGDPPAAQRSFRLAVQTSEEVGSPRGTGLALLGLAAVEAAEGRSERAVADRHSRARVERTRRRRHRTSDGPGCGQPDRRAEGVDPEGQAGRSRGECECVVARGSAGNAHPGTS